MVGVSELARSIGVPIDVVSCVPVRRPDALDRGEVPGGAVPVSPVPDGIVPIGAVPEVLGLYTPVPTDPGTRVDPFAIEMGILELTPVVIGIL